ncbi:MAG: cytochrome-c peroxidase [Candidatus Sulfotelmatobacter sp.]
MKSRKFWTALFGIVVIVGAAAMFHTMRAETPVDFAPLVPSVPDHALAPLKTVVVADPPELSNYVLNKPLAVILGKALFWDMQAGSDGVLACASCHFNAGADSRSTNQVNPGFDAKFDTGVKMNGNVYPNYHLDPGTAQAGWGGYHDGDFPLHKLSDPRLNNTVIADTNDIVGSQGVFASDFDMIVLGSGIDATTIASSAVFSYPDQLDPSTNVNTRQVTGRNTPSNINAVYNVRNFWDGRAMEVCNGANPFGERDTRSHFFATSGTTLQAKLVRLHNASLCSQALGPALSPVEMSANGRIFRELGRKLFSVNPLQLTANTTPLGKQVVDPTDSVLGLYARLGKHGLKIGYADLVKLAFKSQWWNSKNRVCVNPDGSETVYDPQKNKKFICSGSDYSQMEYNFSLYWGVAIQMYESTLRSDQAPLDQYLTGQKSKSIVGDGTKSNYVLTLAPGVTPQTVSLTALDPQLDLSEQEIFAFDDGNGNITGVGVSIGSIDYASGQITLQFDNPISSLVPVRVAYSVGSVPMTQAQLHGLNIFETKGRCVACHGGPEMSNAALTHSKTKPIERMLMRDLSVKVYDNGFYNIGVRPSSEDVGIGGNDGITGAPLSAAEYDRQGVCNDPTLVFNVPARFGEGIAPAPLNCYDAIARNGNFKVPSLRNVGLTAPYFHNGGQLTLEQVVEFYNRGGDFADGLNRIPNIDVDISPLGLTPQEMTDLVDFLRNSLTDPRVVSQAAPFDHPQLFLPNGHPQSDSGYPVQNNPFNPGQATDLPYPMFEVKSTGRKGGPAQKTFLQNLQTQ